MFHSRDGKPGGDDNKGKPRNVNLLLLFLGVFFGDGVADMLILR